MNGRMLMWAGAIVVIALVAWFGLRPPGGEGGVRDVDASGVKKAAEQGAQIIDVRTPGEYQLGHIPGAVNVPVDTVSEAAASWDKSRPYVIYCATGVRSATAVAQLQQLGFTNLVHFKAGIQAWDGELQQGARSANPSGVPVDGKPVLAEFYTDS